MEFMERPLTPDDDPPPRTPLVEIQVSSLREGSPALPSGYLSPASSPDELLIQQRGRKRLPLTWSPDTELNVISSFHSLVWTPPKANSPDKPWITVQPTPRKRRLLFTPEKLDFTDISTPKKFKLNSPL